MLPGSAAEFASFKVGDRISTAGDTPIETFDDLRPALQAAAGKVVTFRVDRYGSGVVLSAHLGSLDLDGRIVGFLGIEANRRAFLSETPAEALSAAIRKTWHAISDTVVGIARAVTTGQGTQNFAGVNRHYIAR